MAREYTLRSSADATPPSEEGSIDFRAELNEQQYAAVTSPPGQALVLAGAGSGKTRTLTYRVAWLLANSIAPENVLLLTFTNKAAREMVERVHRLLPGRASGLWSGTFHSVCNRVLRRHADLLGFTRSFSILDSEDQKGLLSSVIEQSGVVPGSGRKKLGRGKISQEEGHFLKAQVLAGVLSLAANTLQPLEDLILSRFGYFEELIDQIKKVAALYEQRKRESNSMDFDDLLVLTCKLLREHESVRNYYQRQFQFILVDEYQDTNALQSELIDLLAGPDGNIMVVGDDAQSIYSWRGANFQNILSFTERYPQAQVYKIETNYRSVPEVLELANEAISVNERQFKKTLRAARPSLGQKPALVPLPTPAMQAAFVAQRMQDLHEEGIEWKEMAVLYRAHYQALDLQLQLTRAGIPFHITSGLRFFEQAHIKDVTAFLRWVVNPRDEMSFDRWVRLLPGVGPGAAAKLWQQWLATPAANAEETPESYSKILSSLKVPAKAAVQWQQLGHVLDEWLDPSAEDGFQPPSRMIWSLVEGFYDDYLRASYDNARERRQDLEQLQIFAERYEDVRTLLMELALLTNADDVPSSEGAARQRPGALQEDAVTLSTIHQAKGLEWRVVFLIWLTEGMFPNSRVVDEGGRDGLEEERRLFYVALTRAMDQLYLCYPELWPKAYSGDAVQIPSSFLSDFSPDRVEEWNVRAF